MSRGIYDARHWSSQPFLEAGWRVTRWQRLLREAAATSTRLLSDNDPRITSLISWAAHPLSLDERATEHHPSARLTTHRAGRHRRRLDFAAAVAGRRSRFAGFSFPLTSLASSISSISHASSVLALRPSRLPVACQPRQQLSSAWPFIIMVELSTTRCRASEAPASRTATASRT